MESGWPIQICGTGAYNPEKVIDNESFTKYLDTSDEWIRTRTGISERRNVAKTEFTSTISRIASERALEDAGVDAGDVDLIIVATASGDYPFPSTASIIQHELGAKRAGALDVNAACSGFMYGTTVAAGMIAANMKECAIVVGAETLSRFIDAEDRTTCILFGDGAGAAVLKKCDEDAGPRILYSDLGCDGSRTDHIWIPAGGSRNPTSSTTVAERLHFMRMKGREVYKFAVVKMQRLIENALEATGLSTADLKLLIPHQSNLRIIESVQEKLGLPSEKIAVNIDRYGNTSAASVIMAMDEARRSGQLVSGDHALLVAIGAGLVWGTMIVRL